MGQSFCAMQPCTFQPALRWNKASTALGDASPSRVSTSGHVANRIRVTSRDVNNGSIWSCAAIAGVYLLSQADRRRKGTTVQLKAPRTTFAAKNSSQGLALDEGGNQGRVQPALVQDLAASFNERAEKSLLNVGKEHTKITKRWNHPDWDYFDVALIHVRAGRGGHGCKSFRREAHVPLGGPDGGNGGHGGNVYVRCVENLASLSTLTDNIHYRASDGTNGKGKTLDGARGRHRYIDVPPGTCIYVRDAWKGSYGTGERAGDMELLGFEEVGKNLVHEFTKPGEVIRVAKGGKGGRGNRAFKTQTNTAPWVFEVGQKGTQRWLEVELKLIADIGLIGVPNAGKSSLLAVATDAMPRIAPYPFTTVQPNLGFYKHDIHGGLTLCDVPGLLDGASEGRGMGHQFLRHVQRCKTLIHVVSGDSEDPVGDFDMIQAELSAFSSELANKPQVVVVNKCDIPEVQDMLPELMAALRKRCGHTRVFDVSAATRFHVDELMKRVYKWHRSVVDASADESREAAQSELIADTRTLVQYGQQLTPSQEQDTLTLDEDPAPRGRGRRKNSYEARVEWDVLEDAWRLLHPELERVAKETNWAFPEADERFNRVMRATGMTDALTRAGVKDGDPIVVAAKQFRYSPSMEGSKSRMLKYDMDLHD